MQQAAVSAGIANGNSFIRLSEVRSLKAASRTNLRTHSLSLLTSPFQVEFIRPKDVAARFADSAAEEKTGSITAVVFKARAARTLFSQRPAC